MECRGDFVELRSNGRQIVRGCDYPSYRALCLLCTRSNGTMPPRIDVPHHESIRYIEMRVTYMRVHRDRGGRKRGGHQAVASALD